MLKNKKVLFVVIIFIAIVLYGFYEKNRRQILVKDFRQNKYIQCDKLIFKMDDGWMIHNNRFFTNGKIFKTIVFCKSVN